MKLPFDIGSRIAFRTLLPGALFALFLYPLAKLIASRAGVPTSLVVYFSIAIPVCGWVLLLLDMPMYKFLEGRSGWPQWARKMGLRLEAGRLLRLRRRAREAERAGDDIRATELNLEIYKFPMVNHVHRPLFPTRLGNIIAEYERYPSLKYGADGVFYWYRIWLTIDKEMRQELDEKQAMVDGTVYVCCVLMLGGILSALYFGLGLCGCLPTIASIRAWHLALASPGMLLASFIVYRYSLAAHAEYGKYFKALFDTRIGSLDLSFQKEAMSHAVGDSRIINTKGPDACRVVWRYLHWHRFRPPGEKSQDIADLRLRQRPQRRS